MTGYTFGPWIGWNGGECPVEPDTLVDFCTRTHGQAAQIIRAENLAWIHSGAGFADIIAYRVATVPVVETVRWPMKVPGGRGAPYHIQSYDEADGFLVFETLDGRTDKSTLRWEGE